MIIDDEVVNLDCGNTVPFTQEDVKDYFDRAIIAWRESHKLGRKEAKYYIDAFQSARASIFGETLK